MDLFVIGDRDTVLGFAYAGVAGTVVEAAEEAKSTFDEIVTNDPPRILIITETAADLIRQDVDRVRFEAERPIVVEIPGPEGPSPDRRSLLDLIREAVGIRV